MADFPTIRSACDQRASSDTCLENVRSGRQGPVVATRGHGRYYEAAARGRLFTASLQSAGSGSDPTFDLITLGTITTNSIHNGILLNPMNSGVNFVPVRWEVLITTQGTSVTGSVFLYVGTNVPDLVLPQAINGGRSLPLYLSPIGTGFYAQGEIDLSVARAISNIPTIASGPTSFLGSGFPATRFCSLDAQSGQGIGPSRPYTMIMSKDFDGTCILTPGTCLFSTRNFSNSLGGVPTIIWYEVPV